MSIPLDRLYNHIDRLSQRLCDDRLIIYRFFPHGSKNLEDLTALRFKFESKTWTEYQTSPTLICHDQEPLNYDLYSEQAIKNYTLKKYSTVEHCHYFVEMVSKMHLRATTYYPINCYDFVMLAHSEKNSKQLTKYENNGFVGVYWWSHAIIARDWFRYAEQIQQNKQINKLFLIYNRAWSGTREYRLKLCELLVSHNLVSHCQLKINAIEPELGIHYNQHCFDNPAWKPNCILEDYYDTNQTPSHASADFILEDYENTNIELVLETLFDDTRLHLTEKTLRPIALGQPFILVATPGSLKYLQSYGFKTFDSIWSESYDQIDCAEERLQAIVQLMKSMAGWDSTTRQQKMAQAQAIVSYNKNLFFSSGWQDQILKEYQCNIESAWEIMKENRTGKHFFNIREYGTHDPAWNKIINSDLPARTRADVECVLNWIKHPT